MTNLHEPFIQRTFELAKSAVEKGNHPFGALLAKEDEILLEAENTVHTDRDITGHAELNLVRLAGQQFEQETLSQCTLYTSTEPCAMCSGAIYWLGIATVVFGCSCESLAEVTGGNLLLPCREVFARGQRTIEVGGPVLAEDAVKIHKVFWSR